MYPSQSENGDRPRRRFRRIAFHICALLLIAIPSRAQEDPGSAALKTAESFSSRAEYDSALQAYRRAADFFRTSPRTDLYFHSLARIADTYLRMSRMQTADSLVTALEGSVRAQLGEKSKVMADVCRLAGFLKTYQNRYAEAIDYHTRGLEIWRELLPRDSLTQATFQFGIGDACYRSGDSRRAREWLLKAERSQSGYGRAGWPHLVSTLQALGGVEDLLGNIQESIARYEKSLRLCDSLGVDGAVSAVSNRHLIAGELRRAGRLEEALAWEKSALEAGRKLYGNKHLVMAAIRLQLGDYSVLGGDFDAALPYYSEALETFRELAGPDHFTTNEVERKHARLSLFQGKPEESVALYRRVIASNEKTFGAGNPEFALLFSEAGDASLASGDPRGALVLYRRALALLPPADWLGRAGVSLGAGRALSALGKADSAEILYARSLALQDSSGGGTPGLRSETYEAMGNLRETAGNLAEARAMYDRGLKLLTPGSRFRPEATTSLNPSAASRRQLIRLLLALAGVMKQQAGPGSEGTRLLREALYLYELASATIARGRESYRSEVSKLSAQTDLESVCEGGFGLAESLLDRTAEDLYREKALAFAEQSRAGVLLESLERSGRVNGTERDTQRSLKVNAIRVRAGQISRLIDWTNRFGDKQTVPGLREELLGLYTTLDAIEDTIARMNPDQTSRSPLVRLASVSEIQSSLEPGSCMIQFARGPARLSAFVIGQKRFDLVPLGSSAAADSLAGTMRRALRSLDRTRYLSSARSLYRRIILPLASSIRGVRHLVIVPAGGLSYVPFEALIAPAPPRAAPRARPVEIRYLVHDYDISYSLSGTYFCRRRELHATERRRGMSFAGFAPVFRSENGGGNDQQHQYIAQLDPLATRSITVDGRHFTELPWSEQEIRDIGNMIAAGGGSSRCLVEGDATEESFKAGAARAGILHVATHGYIDEENPALSALLFSPSQTPSHPDDGVLYAGEVYDLQLNADLVVLSSCESGVGKMAPGEGLLAMSRGFLSAGARTIAYSLWKVNDRLTGVLMREFYRHILRGDGYASALSNAKRTMIHDNATANPYFWAGFVLLGD